MAQIIEQNTEIHVEETSAPSLTTAPERDVSAPEVSGESPLPSLAVQNQTPAHLASLADRARGYVEAASSANTRKAYAADWKHFAAWCRRSNLAPLPPHPQTVGLYITACASGTAERGAKANSVSTIERRLSSCHGIMRSGGLPSIVGTVTSRPLWPGSATAMPGRPSRRRRSWQKISSPWSRPRSRFSAWPARPCHVAGRLCRWSSSLRDRWP